MKNLFLVLSVAFLLLTVISLHILMTADMHETLIYGNFAFIIFAFLAGASIWFYEREPENFG